MFTTLRRFGHQFYDRFLSRFIHGTDSKGLKSGKSHRTANILLIILLGVSGYATFKGISAFYGLQALGASSLKSDYSLLVVLVFTVLMWYTIDYMVTRGHALINRLGFLVLYIMLALLSVGFGYGLWWGIISAQDSTSKSVDDWVDNLKTGISTTEGQVWQILDQVRDMQAEAVALRQKEETDGGTCGVAWGNTCGPLCEKRKEITGDLEQIGTSINDNWLNKVKTDLTAYNRKVDQEIDAITTSSGGRQSRTEINDKLLGMFEEGNQLQASLNAYSEKYSENQADQLDGIAKVLSVSPQQLGFSCYDPNQAESLRRLAANLRTPPTLEIKKIHNFSDGDNATKVAITSLWRWAIGGLTRSDLENMQAIGFEDAVPVTLRGNDFLALFLTILVDSGIFLLTVSRPRRHFARDDEAKAWLDDNFVGHTPTFLKWFSKYKFDHKGEIYIVRPTSRWTQQKREAKFSVDELALVTGPLVIERLIKEIDPNPELEKLSVQHIEDRGWQAMDEDSRVQIYKIKGSGLAELFAIATS